jgi:energy-coupling factor transporter transmembrane protein EcfT
MFLQPEFDKLQVCLQMHLQTVTSALTTALTTALTALATAFTTALTTLTTALNALATGIVYKEIPLDLLSRFRPQSCISRPVPPPSWSAYNM